MYYDYTLELFATDEIQVEEKSLPLLTIPIGSYGWCTFSWPTVLMQFSVALIISTGSFLEATYLSKKAQIKLNLLVSHKTLYPTVRDNAFFLT